MDEKLWQDPSPWVPMSRPIDQKHMGKLLEEMGEAVEAMVMFSSDTEVHRTRLENELADVRCNIALVQEHFGLRTLGGVYAEPGELSIPEVLRALGDAIAATSRCLIQGIDACEPVSKMPNRDWLHLAFSRLLLRISIVETMFQLHTVRMAERVEFKRRHLRAWHEMLA